VNAELVVVWAENVNSQFYSFCRRLIEDSFRGAVAICLFKITFTRRFTGNSNYQDMLVLLHQGIQAKQK
jgi:hypothetical protein